MIRKAMILCAGLGLRMRPITNTLPKPLIKIAGRSMLDRVFDHLNTAHIQNIVVNTHYLSEKIEASVQNKALISHENTLLETAGGIHKALSLLGNEPFFTLNGDCVWTGSESLTAMNRLWDESHMDVLLLLIPKEKAHGYHGAGDFFMAGNGQLSRRGQEDSAPYVYSGTQVLSPRLFAGEKQRPYSLNVLYDKALKSGRIFGLVHQGEWFHIGTPEDLKKYEPILEAIETNRL